MYTARAMVPVPDDALEQLVLVSAANLYALITLQELAGNILKEGHVILEALDTFGEQLVLNSIVLAGALGLSHDEDDLYKRTKDAIKKCHLATQQPGGSC